VSALRCFICSGANDTGPRVQLVCVDDRSGLGVSRAGCPALLYVQHGRHRHWHRYCRNHGVLQSLPAAPAVRTQFAITPELPSWLDQSALTVAMAALAHAPQSGNGSAYGNCRRSHRRNREHWGLLGIFGRVAVSSVHARVPTNALLAVRGPEVETDVLPAAVPIDRSAGASQSRFQRSATTCG
jgi:hypothetical protein